MKTLPAEIKIFDAQIILSGDYFIEGRVDGRIRSDSKIVVGPQAHVTGEILARTIVVEGRVDADVIARDRCELKSSSVVSGRVNTGYLKLEEGADFSGNSCVGLIPLDGVLNELNEAGD